MKAVLFAILFAILGVPFATADNFTISPTTIEKSVATHSYGFLDLITINSTYNETIILNISYSGDAIPFLLIENSTTAYPNITQLRFNWFVPMIVEPKSYHAYVNFTYNQSIKNTTIKLTVFDNIKPTFLKCGVTDKAYRTKPIFIFCFGVWDNINISRVESRISGPVNATISMEQVAREEYSGNFTSLKAGNYSAVVIATDTSNNLASYDTLRFELLEWVPLTVWEVNFGKVKFLQEHERVIGNVSEIASVLLVLTKLEYTQNVSGNLSLWINGEKLELNSPKNMSFERDIIVKIYSDLISPIEGIIKFTVLDRELYSRIKANFTDYTVPQDIETRWLGYYVKCRSQDTGSYENSTRICELVLPIDSEISEKVGVMPIGIMESYNPERLISLEKDISALKIWRSFLIVGIVILTIALIAYIIYENY